MSIATKRVGAAMLAGSTAASRSPARPATRSSSRSRASPTPRPWSPPSPPARSTRIDPAPALGLPGVLAVISHDNAPGLGETADGELLLFQSDTVHYRGQIVAAVVAETLEQAREAAAAVRIDYAPREPRRRAHRHAPAPLQAGQGQPVVPRRHRPGRGGGGVRTRGGPGRPDLRHRPHPQQRDGAARQPRGLGGRRPAPLRLDPGHLRRAPHPRRGVRARPQARARDRPARRRRLRLQGHAAAAGGARRDRGEDRRAARQVRAHAPADVRQRRLPHADDPARPPRRRPRTACSPRSPTRPSSRPRRCASSPSRPARPRA